MRPHDTAKADRRRPPQKRIAPISLTTDQAAIYDRMLDAKVEVRLRDLLGCSEDLRNKIIEDTKKKPTPPLAAEARVLDLSVEASLVPSRAFSTEVRSLLPYRREENLRSPLLYLEVRFPDRASQLALVDTGAMMNIARKDKYDQHFSHLHLDTSHPLAMTDANGGIQKLLGVVKNVPIVINGAEMRVHLHIAERASFELLLGRPWLEFNKVSILAKSQGVFISFTSRRDGEPTQHRVELVTIAPRVAGDTTAIARGRYEAMCAINDEEGIARTSETPQESHDRQIQAILSEIDEGWGKRTRVYKGDETLPLPSLITHTNTPLRNVRQLNFLDPTFNLRLTNSMGRILGPYNEPTRKVAPEIGLDDIPSFHQWLFGTAPPASQLERARLATAISSIETFHIPKHIEHLRNCDAAPPDPDGIIPIYNVTTSITALQAFAVDSSTFPEFAQLDVGTITFVLIDPIFHIEDDPASLAEIARQVGARETDLDPSFDRLLTTLLIPGSLLITAHMDTTRIDTVFKNDYAAPTQIERVIPSFAPITMQQDPRVSRTPTIRRNWEILAELESVRRRASEGDLGAHIAIYGMRHIYAVPPARDPSGTICHDSFYLGGEVTMKTSQWSWTKELTGLRARLVLDAGPYILHAAAVSTPGAGTPHRHLSRDTAYQIRREYNGRIPFELGEVPSSSMSVVASIVGLPEISSSPEPIHLPMEDVLTMDDSDGEFQGKWAEDFSDTAYRFAEQMAAGDPVLLEQYISQPEFQEFLEEGHPFRDLEHPIPDWIRDKVKRHELSHSFSPIQLIHVWSDQVLTDENWPNLVQEIRDHFSMVRFVHRLHARVIANGYADPPPLISGKFMFLSEMDVAHEKFHSLAYRYRDTLTPLARSIFENPKHPYLRASFSFEQLFAGPVLDAFDSEYASSECDFQIFSPIAGHSWTLRALRHPWNPLNMGRPGYMPSVLRLELAVEEFAELATPIDLIKILEKNRDEDTLMWNHLNGRPDLARELDGYLHAIEAAARRFQQFHMRPDLVELQFQRALDVAFGPERVDAAWSPIGYSLIRDDITRIMNPAPRDDGPKLIYPPRSPSTRSTSPVPDLASASSSDDSDSEPTNPPNTEEASMTSPKEAPSFGVRPAITRPPPVPFPIPQCDSPPYDPQSPLDSPGSYCASLPEFIPKQTDIQVFFARVDSTAQAPPDPPLSGQKDSDSLMSHRAATGEEDAESAYPSDLQRAYRTSSYDNESPRYFPSPVVYETPRTVSPYPHYRVASRPSTPPQTTQPPSYERSTSSPRTRSAEEWWGSYEPNEDWKPAGSENSWDDVSRASVQPEPSASDTISDDPDTPGRYADRTGQYAVRGRSRVRRGRGGRGPRHGKEVRFAFPSPDATTGRSDKRGPESSSGERDRRDRRRRRSPSLSPSPSPPTIQQTRRFNDRPNSRPAAALFRRSRFHQNKFFVGNAQASPSAATCAINPSYTVPPAAPANPANSFVPMQPPTLPAMIPVVALGNGSIFIPNSTLGTMYHGTLILSRQSVKRFVDATLRATACLLHPQLCDAGVLQEFDTLCSTHTFKAKPLPLAAIESGTRASRTPNPFLRASEVRFLDAVRSFLQALGHVVHATSIFNVEYADCGNDGLIRPFAENGSLDEPGFNELVGAYDRNLDDRTCEVIRLGWT
ncbi:hypothetical protein K488DRAFT_92038 [Vararia minispora EC-137]|uniref:Uncharacterized protein n=1 Tax=Vararia minispora EC-137 TaxID=1314806 RepID=A0ACB8Q520_9AGAM|nr:hypothetical protein K488DRAFT_92038 [Vararia minispora EC-137]